LLILIHARKADVFVHGTTESPSQFNQHVLNWLQFARTVVLQSSSLRSFLPSAHLFTTMVFTAAQLIAFFTTADYLGLSARTAAAIAAEGITEPADLAEFDKEGLDAIFRNLCKPPCALQGGAGRGAAGRSGSGGRGLVDVEPFIVPAKSQMRIYTSALAVQYYVATACELDPDNMPWVVVKGIVEKKKMDVPDAPKLTKGLAVYKWVESVRNHLNQVIGVRLLSPTSRPPAW
jgi:hypothetical protein